MNSDLLEKIQLYRNTYVKGEVRSPEYETRIKQEKALNIKLDLADTIFNEIPFQFQTWQKDTVKQIITLFPNFKDLHSKATNEEIILSIIFYVKALETKELKINNKLVETFVEPEKQELYPRTCEIIGWKITLHYIQKQPIRPRLPKGIDHNILYKGNYTK